MSFSLKTPTEIEHMRRGGKILAEILNRIGDTIRPGISTAELNDLALTLCRENNIKPSFLGYRGFPAAICASVNTGVVHNIPRKNIILNSGDLVKIDFGVHSNGLHTDACQTFGVGELNNSARNLLERTKIALYRGIEQAVAGNTIGDIGHAIESYVRTFGYSPVRETVGHGIGKHLHEDPEVPNWGRPGKGPKLIPGMTICIEPIINAGGSRIVTDDDGWTTTTADDSLSAHFEHTLLITKDAAEILTPWDRERI